MGYALRTEEQYTGLSDLGLLYGGVNLISDKLFRARSSAPSQSRKIELEVEVAGQRFKLISNRADLPGPVRESLNRINDLVEFEADWNSYESLRLNPKAVRPAVELILGTFPRCMTPEISLTPAGGINLFWSGGQIELEVEVRADGLCDYEFENGETGEQVSPNAPVPLADIQKLLHHLCP